MTVNTFFNRLIDELKKLKTNGTLLFGESVHLIPIFPLYQIPNKISPSCYIMDLGSVPHIEYPNVLSQSFSVGIWYENTRDAYGGDAMHDLITMETALFTFLNNLTTLGGEKVLIRQSRKTPATYTIGNFPCVFRTWSYDVITDI